MATIKALEGCTVHQIQSGQVIVDLCSVVKELIENSLDAGATSIDVRFKNNGLQSIEVQDNGAGISPENFETVALKHYTSKLSSYDDLDSLQTFGFRGEALSSLCALSDLHIVTARAEDVPKGTRLNFQTSGQVRDTAVVASQRGTLVAVENLFSNLPVRRRDLEKNIKREYGKVLGIIQAYACISTNVKLSVSNILANGRKTTAFATKSNPSTRENIANVFGAKALGGLLAMNLTLELKQSRNPLKTDEDEQKGKQVIVQGHVSRPVFGEGRQQPDRQMFFVNSRPCGLPQMARVFNEVYKSYNLSQSPFIFANIILDTNAYDVNVSPDKRTILLHDQEDLLETLRGSLIELFDRQDHTVPQSQGLKQTLPHYKQLTVQRSISTDQDHEDHDPISSSGPVVNHTESEDEHGSAGPIANLIESFATRDTKERSERRSAGERKRKGSDEVSLEKQKLIRHLARGSEDRPISKPAEVVRNVGEVSGVDSPSNHDRQTGEVHLERESEGSGGINVTTTPKHGDTATNTPLPAPTSSIVQNAYDRMRPRRITPEVAKVTIGDHTTTMLLGPTTSKVRNPNPVAVNPRTRSGASQAFSNSLKAFVASGGNDAESQEEAEGGEEGGEDEEHEDQEDASKDDGEYPSGVSEDEGDVSPSFPKDIEAQVDLDHSLRQGSIEEPEANKDTEGQAVPSASAEDVDSDEEYIDDADKKRKEEAKVARLIQEAEEAAARPTQDNVRRAHNILKGAGSHKDTTRDLTHTIQVSDLWLQRQQRVVQKLLDQASSLKGGSEASTAPTPILPSSTSPEDRLSLTVSKSDFSKMHIIGQFNLGFILALRSPSPSLSSSTSTDLFIIDQHASDEKINFERLRRDTVMQTQRLVRPLPLDLTAIEEEIILENQPALEANGFQISIDMSSDLVGKRCKLISLPMSQNITFTLYDLEELMALLAEETSSRSPESSIPRPTKIRKIFASRACRSSVMIGKPLTKSQMRGLVGRMGGIEKPWNCPHGRPTMRHVLDLAAWDGWFEERKGEEGLLERLRGWDNGDEVVEEEEDNGEEDGSAEDVGEDGFEKDEEEQEDKEGEVDEM